MRLPTKMLVFGAALSLYASSAGATPFIIDVWRVKVGGVEIGRVAATAGAQPSAWSEWVEKRDAGWTWAGPGVPWDIEATTATSLNCNTTVGGVAYRKCQEAAVLGVVIKKAPTSAITQPQAANSERVLQYHASGRYAVVSKTGATTAPADLYITPDAVDPALRREVFCASPAFAWPAAGPPATTWHLEWVSADGAAPAVCPAGREGRFEAIIRLAV